jgi:hypothetical protein
MQRDPAQLRDATRVEGTSTRSNPKRETQYTIPTFRSLFSNAFPVVGISLFERNRLRSPDLPTSSHLALRLQYYQDTHKSSQIRLIITYSDIHLCLLFSSKTSR